MKNRSRSFFLESPVAKWLREAIKHPGAEKRAAKKHGLSTRQEAEREAHSSNPHIRGRGLLAERLIGGRLKKKKRSRHRGGRS